MKMNCCISQFLIFASDSSKILVKEYRKNVSENNKDVIIKEIVEQSTEFYKPYLVLKNKIHCFVIKRENVYFCAITSSKTDEINVLEILTRFADIVQDFCGLINEKAVRNNIVLIYEILEEFLVDGYVQVDSTEKMKPLIFSEPNVTNNCLRNNSWDILGLNSELDMVVPSHASNQPIVRQRSEQPTAARKKEIFLDFLETLSVTIEKDGTASRKQLLGRLVIKCFLSGSHSLRIGFDPLGPFPSMSDDLRNNLNEITYHDSVRKCKDGRSISFQAPDREVTIMRFKMDGESIRSIPFKFSCAIQTVTNSSRDLNLCLKISTNLPSPNAEVSKVIVTLPVPESTTSITQNLSGTFQSAHLDEEGKQLTWTLKKIPDRFELQADFRLINSIGTSITESEARLAIGPATLDFEIAGHSVSGTRISSLVVEDSSDARTMRWIRYILSSDSYVVKF